MQGAVLYGPGDVRFEERPDPTLVEPTDAILLLRLAATCVCGSDLWPYRGVEKVSGPTPMGHEYCGYVEEVGRDVKTIKPGQFVVGSFFASDNTCPICQAGYQTHCVNRQPPGAATGAQAPYLRVPLADGTLVALPELPGDALVASLLATSDVLGTGWFAADAAAVGPGKTVEKLSYLPRELTTEGSSASPPDNGDLIYFVPWGNLGFFYNADRRDTSFDDRVIPIGTLVSVQENLHNLETGPICAQLIL